MAWILGLCLVLFIILFVKENRKAVRYYNEKVDALNKLKELTDSQNRAVSTEVNDEKSDNILRRALADKEKEIEQLKLKTKFARKQVEDTYDKEDILPEDFIIWGTKKIPSKYLHPNKEVTDTSHYFYRKKVVITGDFSCFPYRAEMASWLHDVGADVDVSVSKLTDCIVIGEDPGWRKMDTAKTFRIQIINQEEFLKYFPDKKPKFI